jgi:hypothetical protein
MPENVNWHGFRSRIEGVGDIDHHLWMVALVFFGLGDLVTTAAGLGMAGVSEGSPITAVLIERYGAAVMVLQKLLVFGGSYALWRLMPRPHRLGSPLALAVLGIVVTWWNVSVLARAAL